MKNQKGITLIALVITIIVLLILAGVSIAMLTGENGLLNKTKTTVAANAIAGAKDEVSLVHQQAMTNYLEKKFANEDTTADFVTEFKTLITNLPNNSDVHGCKVEYDDGTKTVTITYNNDETKTATGTINASNELTWTNNY